jgi:hypothetical protein
MTALEACPGCHLRYAPLAGATDPYGGASAACWALFGEACARDYGEFRYPPIHRTMVDAYMAQHPGYATAAGRRSVIVHLVGLHLTLERGLPNADVIAAIRHVFPDKRDVVPLLPVPVAWDVTVDAMVGAADLDDHTRRARRWAEAVWKAWTPHHPSIRKLAP